MTSEKVNTFEKHAVGIIAAIILAVLLWVGGTVVTLKEAMAASQVQQNNMGAQSVRLESEVKELKGEIRTLRDQVSVAALAAAQAATAAALAALPQVKK